MGKLTALIWVMVGTVFMGMLVTVTLTVPYFANAQAFWLPVAAATGAVLALPFSYFVARKLKSSLVIK